jgi:hypothetical protein
VSAARDIISALVAGGMDAIDAASLVARASVEMTAGTGRSSNAERQQRYRDRNKSVTKRNETVTERNANEQVETVTNRNESVTNRNVVTPPSIVLDKKLEKKDRGSQLPEGWKPDDVRWTAACRKFGVDGAERELNKFTSHHRAKGTVFKNWSFAWDKWLLNSADWAPKQAPGVGVVNPETVNWRAALQSFKNFGNWPKGHGNDPTSPACRAPPELLREYGFEPVIPALRAM